MQCLDLLFGEDIVMTKLEKLFAMTRARNKSALMPFVVAGDPDLAFTTELVAALADAGADMIEVGVPFSDPLADGPVIQAAYTRALARGATLDAVLAAAPAWTARLPVVLMLYYNLVFSRGVKRAAEDFAAAGIAGVIVPDLPPEEAEAVIAAFAARGIDFIVMLTPTTPPERAARLAARAGGFIYYVALAGVTGARRNLRAELRAEVAAARAHGLPVCVGFGVAKAEHVAELSEFADGVIVGSALVQQLDAAGDGRAAKLMRAREFIGSLAAARKERK